MLPWYSHGAEVLEPEPTVQQADFWLWFSRYGDSEGNIFDPADLEQISGRDEDDDQYPSTQAASEDFVNETKSTVDGHESLRLKTGEEGL